jgi:peptidoglycan/xylan/chitin deacetylase (PgdA/CDA1 family)
MIYKFIYRLFPFINSVITHVKTNNPVIALTFDDGPHPKFTPRLLNILAKHSAKASFFITGQRAVKYPEILKLIYQSGHSIGNHSWDHSSFPILSHRARKIQLQMSRHALRKYDCGLFRPPFGHLNNQSKLDVYLSGYKIVTWNIHVEDWLNHSQHTLYNHIVEKLVPGSIILLHDNLLYSENNDYNDRSQTLLAVDRLLSDHKDFNFITVDTLIKLGDPVYRPWNEHGSKKWLSSLRPN